MRSAILLTGKVGTGKTTTLLALDELLEAQPEPYALVDLDWLCWVRPAGASEVTVGDALLANLAAVMHTYRTAGIERLVLARAAATAANVDAIRAVLDGTELVVVRLVAPRAVLEARLQARDTGAELEEHLALLDDEPAFPAVEVASDRPPREVALAVLAAAGW